MKRILILILLSLIAQLSFAQEKTIKVDTALFEKGELLQELVNENLQQGRFTNIDEDNSKLMIEVKNLILEKALHYYEDLVKYFPKSELMLEALNNAN